MSAETVGNGVVVAGNVDTASSILNGMDSEDVGNAPAPEATPDETPDWAKDPKSAQEYVEKLRKENAKFRTRAKEFEDDAKYNEALKALETVKEQKLASMSDVDRAKEEAKTAAERASSLEQELNRERAARKHNLPDDLIEFLTGSADEIEAKAVRLAAFAAQDTTPRPSADRSQGLRDAGLPTKEQAIRNMFDFS